MGIDCKQNKSIAKIEKRFSRPARSLRRIIVFAIVILHHVIVRRQNWKYRFLNHFGRLLLEIKHVFQVILQTIDSLHVRLHFTQVLNVLNLRFFNWVMQLLDLITVIFQYNFRNCFSVFRACNYDKIYLPNAASSLKFALPWLGC